MGGFANFGFMIVPFAVYVIAATAETNRAPFDLPEAESELVAGSIPNTAGSAGRFTSWPSTPMCSCLLGGRYGSSWVAGSGRSQRGVVSRTHEHRFSRSALPCFCVLSMSLVRKLKSLIHKQLMVVVALAWRSAPYLRHPRGQRGRDGLFWFLAKVFGVIYVMIWFRGTFPRYRYDQLMNIGWKIAIPMAWRPL